MGVSNFGSHFEIRVGGFHSKSIIERMVEEGEDGGEGEDANGCEWAVVMWPNETLVAEGSARSGL